MNIRNTTVTSISIAIAIAITTATAGGLIANAASSYAIDKTHAALATQSLQRLPTIVVMSEPEYQRLEAVVVTANPADYEDSNDRSVAVSDWMAPARAATTQLVRNAAFDMPYYSFGKAHTLAVKE